MPIRRVMLLLFFSSGFSALIYEIVWARMLGLIIGTSVAAWGTVLAVYMGGMALGCWAGGKLADRVSRPMLLFALCEAGIGLFGAASPALLHLAHGAYISLLSLFGTSADATVLPRVIMTGVLFVIPTALMGCTLPAVSRAVFSKERLFGRDLGLIYSVNTFGAVAGSLTAGFALLPAFGMSVSLLTAAVINCAVAAAALLFASRSCEDDPAKVPFGAAVETPLPHTLPAWLLPSVLVCSGFCAMAFEVLWSRGLVFSLSSTTYAFTTVLSVVLAGLAAGSLAAAVIARNSLRVPAWIAGLQLCIGIVGLSSPWMLQHIDTIIRFAENHLGHSWWQWLTVRYLVSSGMILVPALCMGATFPLVIGASIKSLSAAGRAVGSLSSLNTLGGIAGALAAAFLLIPAAGIQRSLVIIAVINCIAGLAVMGYKRGTRKRTAAAAALVSALAVISLTFTGRNPLVIYSRAVSSTGGPVSLESYKEDQSAGVAVLKNRTGRTLNIDGFNAAGTFRYEYMHLLAHLPVLLSPSPDTALVICLGTGTTCGIVGLYPSVKLVECVEISPAVIASARKFSDVNYNCMDNPKIRVRSGDGRNHLLTTRRRYDVITLEPMHPYLASATNLYSTDFYLLCRSRLTAHGVMAQWAPMHALSSREYRSLIASFAGVFPHASLWFLGTEGILVGAMDSLRIDLSVLKRAMSAAAPMGDLAKISLASPERLLSCFLLDKNGIRNYVNNAPVISDDRPVLEFSAPRNLVLPLERMWRDNAEEILKRRVSILPFLTATDSASTEEIRRYETASSLMMKAGILNTRQQFFQAMAAADSALALMSGDTTARLIRREAMDNTVLLCLNEARGFRSQGLLLQAEQAYLQAVAIDPLCAPAYTELATLYTSRGMKEKGLDHARKAVIASPDDPAMHTNLAVSYMNCNRYADAETELLRALAIDQNYGRAYDFLAELYRETGRENLAQPSLRRAGEPGHRQR
jgi:spermidine synthase